MCETSVFISIDVASRNLGLLLFDCFSEHWIELPKSVSALIKELEGALMLSGF